MLFGFCITKWQSCRKKQKVNDMFDKFIENLIKFLAVFGFCGHKWVIHKQNELTKTDLEAVVFYGNSDKWTRVVGTRYYLRCERCGNMKLKEFGV